mmetsp:Transcript_28355/g.76571  ORF Transcript_28355/g.76571 Transcript_28355/m.76571 type:complete len:99 (+) Transcript_28355:3-299(+)
MFRRFMLRLLVSRDRALRANHHKKSMERTAERENKRSSRTQQITDHRARQQREARNSYSLAAARGAVRKHAQPPSQRESKPGPRRVEYSGGGSGRRQY